jgi:hypothetical protein
LFVSGFVAKSVVRLQPLDGLVASVIVMRTRLKPRPETSLIQCVRPRLGDQPLHEMTTKQLVKFACIALHHRERPAPPCPRRSPMLLSRIYEKVVYAIHGSKSTLRPISAAAVSRARLWIVVELCTVLAIATFAHLMHGAMQRRFDLTVFQVHDIARASGLR